MSKNYLQSLLFYALCFCLCCDVLFKNSRVAAQPAPVLNSLYPRRIPSTVGYVVLEGSNFGTNISNIAVTFSSTSGNSSPCSSLNQPFPSYLNCSLSLPNNLSNSTSYNIFISVGSQNSNSLPFQTGAFNTAPLIRDADFVMINKASMTIYINAVDPDDNSELSRFLAIKPPGNGTTVPAMIASSPAFRVFNTDRTIRYTPNANFIGIDSLQVQALDQFNATTISVSVPRIRTIHPGTLGPITLNLCPDNTCVEAVNATIKAIPRGTLRIIKGSSSVPIASTPYFVEIDSATRFEYSARDSVRYIETSLTYKLANENFDNTLVLIAGSLSAKNVQIKTKEGTPVVITLQCDDFPLEAVTFGYSLTSSPDNSKGEFFQYNGDFNSSNNEISRINGTRLRINDGNGRMYFNPRENYTGIFEVQYTCSDQYGRISPAASVKITVTPVLNCKSKTDIQSILVIGANRDFDRDGILFRFLSVPEEGIFVRPGLNRSPIRAGDVVDVTAVQYITNITGGSILGGNFTYVAVNRFNDSSDPCTVQFVVSCAPLYLNIYDSSTTQNCVECPSGAVCSFNGIRKPYAAAGFWYNSEEQLFLPCIPRTACPGEPDRSCAEGYQGTRCAECATNYYKLNNQCVSCTETEVEFILLISACIIFGALLWYTFWSLVGKSQGLGIFNITCNFIQTALILRNIKMNWPSEIQSVLDYFSFFNFNLELSSPECLVEEYLNFSVKMKMALSIPLILMGILFATILLYFMFSLVIRLLQKKGWISSNDTNRTHTDMPKDSEFRGKRHISRTFIIIFNSSLSLVYNTVASYSLALFDCTQEGDGFYYLDSDPSLRCYEDWWYADLKFAISGIVFYVLGIPVYFGVILYFSRREASPGSFWGSFQNYCNVIATSDTSYKSNRTGFMLLQFFHKLMLISISMFFTRYLSFQILLSIYSLMITFIMTLKYQPYVHDSLNYLEVHSIGSNIVLLTSGLLFYNDQLTPALKAIAIDAVIAVILGFILAAIFAAGYEVKLGFSRRMAKYKSVDNLSQKAPKETVLLVQKSSGYLSRFRNNSRQRK